MNVLNRTVLPRLSAGLALFVAVMTISGCASKPLANDPDLAKRSLGEVTLKIAESNTTSGEPGLIKAYAKYDESKRFMHWQHQFQYACATCNGRQAVLANFLNAYKPYCQIQGGTWVVTERYQDGFYASGTCGAPDSPVIFSVFPAYSSLPYQGTTLHFILADSFQAKGSASMTDLRSSYVVDSVIVPSTFRLATGDAARTFGPWIFSAWQEDTPERAVARKAAKATEREASSARYKEETAKREAWVQKARQGGAQACRTLYPVNSNDTRTVKIFGTTLSANGDKLTIRVQSIREYNGAGVLVNAHSHIIGNAQAESVQPKQDLFYQVGDSVTETIFVWGPC